jgi:signal transduction histidine kinase
MVTMSERTGQLSTGSDDIRKSERFFRDIEIPFLIHELKDPISIIETGLRTLLEKQDKFGPLTPKQTNTLKRALRNSQKARAMLSNLLEIGRSEAGCLAPEQFAPVPATFKALREAIEIMMGAVADELNRYDNQDDALQLLSRHGVLLVVAPSLMRTQLDQDEVKYRQIVGNLIKNALHHRRRWMEVRMELDDDILVVAVSDDGPGIDPEHHEMVFKRYAQVDTCSITPRKGHGLGLAGAQILARSLGGDVELKSEKGKGATFRLTLPTKCRQ